MNRHSHTADTATASGQFRAFDSHCHLFHGIDVHLVRNHIRYRNSLKAGLLKFPERMVIAGIGLTVLLTGISNVIGIIMIGAGMISLSAIWRMLETAYFGIMYKLHPTKDLRDEVSMYWEMTKINIARNLSYLADRLIPGRVDRAQRKRQVRVIQNLKDALDKLENILAGDQNEGAARKWAAVKKEFDLDQALEDLVEISAETREGVERIITIAANLRTFARNGSQDRKRFQVRNCLESSLTMVMYKYKSGIKLQQEHQPVPDVLGNPAEVGQVLMNLMVNAAQAMNGSGILTLRTFIEDDWVKVSIGDTGPGIPEHLLERIFEPLFTTKEAGQGTGLGLAISRDIIERHGGRIEVSSEPGQGAVFTVMLPALVEEG